MLDENRYKDLTIMDGYNERELELSKIIKGRTVINFNPVDYYQANKKPENKKYYGTFIRLYTYLTYSIMAFNANKRPDEFIDDSALINGFSTGAKVSINPIFDISSLTFVIALDLAYGFDIIGYQNRYDRLLVTLGIWYEVKM